MMFKAYLLAAILALTLATIAGCVTPEMKESAHANLDIITDRMFEKTKGRITAAHLQACRTERLGRMPKIKVAGEPVFQPSRFYTCAISNTFFRALDPNEHYIAYVGKQPVARERIPGLQPGDRDLHVKLICAYRVRAETVQLDNSMIPTTIASNNLCRYARDAPLLIPKRF